MGTSEKLQNVFDSLFNRYGPQHWWPGDTPFEVMVGAILTQNTNWGNVEKAINNLKAKQLLDPFKLLELDTVLMAELIKPAGYFNIKTKRLKNFLALFCGEFDGSVERMQSLSLNALRESLLAVNGIGRETADSILLYALQKPIFVVDAYTHRLLKRHSLIDEEADYDLIQSVFMENLVEDVAMFNEFHALIVRVGKDHCRPTPRCDDCPLTPPTNL